MFPDADVDPCELYFDDYRSVDGQLLPHRIQVRFGDRLFATWKLEEVKLTARLPEVTP
jgi:hypothetical protein